MFLKNNEYGEVTTFRLPTQTKQHLEQIKKWDGRASNNNVVVWLIDKEYRKQKRRRISDAKSKS